MKNEKYTKLDKKIDEYLKTNNLRPGPPARLVNRIIGVNQNSAPIAQKINYFSFSITVEKNIPWDDLLGVKISDYGSEQSYFLEFLNNKLLILKSGKDIPLYYFGALMCECYGVKTPKYRLLEYSDPEFNKMLLNLERASNDPAIHNKILFEIKEYPFVLVYEYIPFLSLFDIGKNRSEILLTEKHFQSRGLMIEIGQLLTLDILLNNSKRLPFVWLNNGDPNNILFKVILDLLEPNSEFKKEKIIDIYFESIYAIDTYPFILDPNDKVLLRNLGEYLNSVNEFFKLLSYEFKSIVIYGKELETFEFKSFDKLVTLFKNCTGYRFTPTNLFHIAMGMLIMINDIITSDLEPIELILQFLPNSIAKDWANTFANSISNIKEAYFKHMIDFFKNIRDDNDQIFNWVEDTTLGIYSFDSKENTPIIIENQENMRYSISDGNVPINREEEKEEDKKEEEKEEIPKDFFNYNKDDNKPFLNDVHNGIYDMYELNDGLILEYRERVYKKIDDLPPKPDPIPKVVLPPQEKKPEIEVIKENEHIIYTMEELKNKIKREELFNHYLVMKKNNPEEAKYLEDQIKEIDPQFLSEMQKEKNEEEEEKKREEKKEQEKKKEEEKKEDEEEEEEEEEEEDI